MAGRSCRGGVRVSENQAEMLAHAEQIRAAQQLTGEQVGQLVRQTRSRTKAARTQAAPLTRASSSEKSGESKDNSSSSNSNDSG